MAITIELEPDAAAGCCARNYTRSLDVDNPLLKRKQRAENLLTLRGGNVDVFLADVTLEWDLARAQPRDHPLTETMTLVHRVSGPEVAGMSRLSPTAWATELKNKLTAKAVFAQELAAKLDADPKQKLVVTPAWRSPPLDIALDA